MEEQSKNSGSRSVAFYLSIFLVLGFSAILIGAAYVHFNVQNRLQMVYDIDLEPIFVPTSAESIERGRHLVETLAGCQDCHGDDLGGTVLYEGALEGRIVASNLTRGEGGVGSFYSDQDWARAILHGVDPDGKPLVYVSSLTLNKLSDADVGAMIAYLKTIPPVDNQLPDTSIGILSSLTIFNDPTLLPAEVIDHDAPRPLAPEPGITAEYGLYLTVACRECHGPDLTGRPSVVGAGKNLTQSGDLGNWTELDFMRALKTGYTPEYYQLDPELMPWKRMGQLSDDEIRAIWLYLESLQN